MHTLDFQQVLSRPELAQWEKQLTEIIDTHVTNKKHGHLPRWLELISSFPSIDGVKEPIYSRLNDSVIQIGKQSAMNQEQQCNLLNKLQQLKPWRKGPYNFFGIAIDTEWRSDWKWDRIAPHISPLSKRHVLDVGCGSGYHCWRMLGEGASYVMGIDPTLRFFMQYLACQHFLKNTNFDFIPIGIEHLPEKMTLFDTTFSMGVLYHRRDMQQHIIELKNTLRPEGELVLETLIVDPDCPGLRNGVLVPQDRYAAMRNVWNIPTIARLEIELQTAGFTDIHCIEENVTSLDEQRQTAWIDGYSLKEFLDPNDQSKTREGYPAPKRATMVARKSQP